MKVKDIEFLIIDASVNVIMKNKNEVFLRDKNNKLVSMKPDSNESLIGVYGDKEVIGFYSEDDYLCLEVDEE